MTTIIRAKELPNGLPAVKFGASVHFGGSRFVVSYDPANGEIVLMGKGEGAAEAADSLKLAWDAVEHYHDDRVRPQLEEGTLFARRAMRRAPEIVKAGFGGLRAVEVYLKFEVAAPGFGKRLEEVDYGE